MTRQLSTRVTLDLKGRHIDMLRRMAASARWPQTRVLRTGIEIMSTLGSMLRQGHTIEIRDSRGVLVALPKALRLWEERVEQELRCASELTNQEQELGLAPTPSAPASSSMTYQDSQTPRP